MKRRHFLSASSLASLAACQWPGDSKKKKTPEDNILLAPAPDALAQATNERSYWATLLTTIATPVLSRASQGNLQQSWTPEVSPIYDKRNPKVAYMEAIARLLAGMAPWLALPDNDSEEGRQRQTLRKQALQALKYGVDPKSPDYFLWHEEDQPLIESGHLVQAFLLAPDALWNALDENTRNAYLQALQGIRRIEPSNNNWLMVVAMVETFLWTKNSNPDLFRLYFCLDKMEDWYVGDGWYQDGESFRSDYYNSYVIHPQMVLTTRTLLAHAVEQKDEGLVQRFTEMYDKALQRMQRYCEYLERIISPEGAYPPLGRSATYRLATFQPLALAALMKSLPAKLPPAQVRSALSATARRMFDQKGMFNTDGFLTLGFAGHQPGMADRYSNAGSMYATTLFFLALGLTPDDAFWADPEMSWTQKKAWNGEDFLRDEAFKG